MIKECLWKLHIEYICCHRRILSQVRHIFIFLDESHMYVLHRDIFRMDWREHINTYSVKTPPFRAVHPRYIRAHPVIHLSPIVRVSQMLDKDWQKKKKL